MSGENEEIHVWIKNMDGWMNGCWKKIKRYWTKRINW